MSKNFQVAIRRTINNHMQKIERHLGHFNRTVTRIYDELFYDINRVIRQQEKELYKKHDSSVFFIGDVCLKVEKGEADKWLYFGIRDNEVIVRGSADNHYEAVMQLLSQISTQQD